MPLVAAYFEYPCPDCRTATNLHDPTCRFAERRWHQIEKAYLDLIAPLSVESLTEPALREASHGGWDALHEQALGMLQREHRVRETEEGFLELLAPAERDEIVSEPTSEPMKTIFEKGSVPGCHDNAVFALIAWFEMVGFSWEETRERVIQWLHDSGTWERGGFEEDTPAALVDKKRHVFDQGYGWKEKAQSAKHVIDRSL